MPRLGRQVKRSIPFNGITLERRPTNTVILKRWLHISLVAASLKLIKRYFFGNVTEARSSKFCCSLDRKVKVSSHELCDAEEKQLFFFTPFDGKRIQNHAVVVALDEQSKHTDLFEQQTLERVRRRNRKKKEMTALSSLMHQRHCCYVNTSWNAE